MGIKAIMGAKLGSLSLKRTTSTNPFEHNSFRGKSFGGSVLPFADVFQSIKPVEPKTSKIKMISGSVIGAVSSFKTRLTQPIIDFAHNVSEKVAVGIQAVKNARNSIVEAGKNIHGKISSVFEHNRIAEESKDIPKILKIKKINNKASIQDLRATWLAENEIIAKGVEEAGKVAA